MRFRSSSLFWIALSAALAAVGFDLAAAFMQTPQLLDG
jgi:hypothetical protein